MSAPSTPQTRDQRNLALADFGWSEGWYTIPCIDCPKENHLSLERLGAKRSIRCKEHAEEALKAHETNSFDATGSLDG